MRRLATLCLYIFLAVTATWSLFNLIGPRQAVKTFLRDRGVLLRSMGSLIIARWLPTALFIGGILALYVVKFGLPMWVKQLTAKDELAGLPGFSLHAAMQIHHRPADRPQYMFDFGTPERERLSVYISPNDVFTVSFAERADEPHRLHVHLGGSDGIPLDQLFHLDCDLAVANEATFLRVFVNAKEVGSMQLPLKANVGALDISNGQIGTDLNGQNGGHFYLYAVSKRLVIPTKRERKKGQNPDTVLKPNGGSPLAFKGSQWVKFDQAANSKIPDTPHTPKREEP
jgi:hypothetical protein